MAVNDIIEFAAPSAINDDAIQKATQAVKDDKFSGSFTIGSQVKDPNTLQITLEHDGSANVNTLLATLRKSFGKPSNHLSTSFPTPALSSSGPSTSPIVEHVLSTFPSSLATPAFQAKIIADFERFESIYNPTGAVTPPGKLSCGWVEGEYAHPEIAGEKGKGFLVVRGWEAMSDFQKSVEGEGFKEAGPILFGWGAPFRMVSHPSSTLLVWCDRIADACVMCVVAC